MANNINGKPGKWLNLNANEIIKVINASRIFTPLFSTNNIMRAYTKAENKKLARYKFVFDSLLKRPMVINTTNSTKTQMSLFDLMK